jgi:hypothetical protein
LWNEKNNLPPTPSTVLVPSHERGREAQQKGRAHRGKTHARTETPTKHTRPTPCASHSTDRSAATAPSPAPSPLRRERPQCLWATVGNEPTSAPQTPHTPPNTSLSSTVPCEEIPRRRKRTQNAGTEQTVGGMREGCGRNRQMLWECSTSEMHHQGLRKRTQNAGMEQMAGGMRGGCGRNDERTGPMLWECSTSEMHHQGPRKRTQNKAGQTVGGMREGCGRNGECTGPMPWECSRSEIHDQGPRTSTQSA